MEEKNIMKFKKIMPLVLAAPLLASCGGGGLKVEEHGFSSYSNKVDYATFAFQLKAASAIPEIKDETTLGSYEAKIKYSEAITNKYELDSTLNHNIKTCQEFEFKFDSSNLLLEEKEKYEGLQESNFSSGTYNGTQTNEESTFEQITNDKALTVDLKNKTYSENETTDNVSYIKEGAYSFYSDALSIDMISDYESLDDKEKNKYRFYVDGTVFTWVYLNDAEEELHDYNDEYKVIGKSTTGIAKKGQINISSKNIKTAYACFYEVDINFTAEGLFADSKYDIYEIVKPGHKANLKNEEYNSSEVEIKDVSLKAIDLTDYKKFEGDN